MAEEIKYTVKLTQAFIEAYEMAFRRRHEFVMPEHFLASLFRQDNFRTAIRDCGGKAIVIMKRLSEYLNGLETVPVEVDYNPEYSHLMRTTLERSAEIVLSCGKNEMDVPHVAKAILTLTDSLAADTLKEAISGRIGSFLASISEAYRDEDSVSTDEEGKNSKDDDYTSEADAILENEPDFDNDREDDYDLDFDFGSMDDDEFDDAGYDEGSEKEEKWKDLVTCVNDNTESRNPLVGRDDELERTIRVLCRKEKNNPLHIGEPGVGKTALVYGLAEKINKGDVPERLKGSRIYLLDIGSLIAGTQFRGDFEKRIKRIMEGASKEGNAIIYIDEIHNLVGAGSTNGNSLDASNMLKPYLESDKVRFIGSTTYDEYKRYFARSKGIVRRFQQIDILEPGEEETIRILTQLKKGYEKYHGVHYTPSAIEFAVKGSARYISGRFLPDKAIDLIDEAGAYRELHPIKGQKRQTVDKTLIAEMLSKICKVDAVAMKADDTSRLSSLESRIASQIFGQDKAVKEVTEAIQLSKAGLTEEGKPIASLLFVGPTGVGKTEVAKVLAKELGIDLLRFDMSEYTEKHTVAKLIGSPAGYVGYEDGGLLTDAIRKTPNCVLLLDEIEKAHPDIYNILLQVMDYARLTDNKGEQADFSNVVLIMTSNAGAQHARQSKLGFASTATAGSAMLSQVKKTFKPEFINRLTATVVFNDMDVEMARLILDKKLNRLRQQLAEKKVELELSEEAFNHILGKGFTREYGARELDRVISSELKPLLMRSILFGKLKKGGMAKVSSEGGKLLLQ